MTDQKKDYLGHRLRLKEKFYKFPASVEDYEILEMILFLSIPRKDTKSIAKSLIKTFESLENLIFADEDKIFTIPKITKNIHLSFLLIKEFIKRILQNKILNKHVLSSWNELIEYLKVTMGSIKKEQFRVIFLDKKNTIIADELQASGTIDETPIYPREVVKRALFHESTAIILVHNHPSGNLKPSKADIEVTKEIIKVCSTFNILVHDHVIICKRKFFSFKSEYLL